jgi:hypothetical protein
MADVAVQSEVVKAYGWELDPPTSGIDCMRGPVQGTLPARVDLRPQCPPVNDSETSSVRFAVVVPSCTTP